MKDEYKKITFFEDFIEFEQGKIEHYHEDFYYYEEPHVESILKIDEAFKLLGDEDFTNNEDILNFFAENNYCIEIECLKNNKRTNIYRINEGEIIFSGKDLKEIIKEYIAPLLKIEENNL